MRLRATLYGGQHAIVHSFYTNREGKSTGTFGERIKLSKDSGAIGAQRFQYLAGNEAQRQKGWKHQCVVGNFAVPGKTKEMPQNTAFGEGTGTESLCGRKARTVLVAGNHRGEVEAAASTGKAFCINHLPRIENEAAGWLQRAEASSSAWQAQVRQFRYEGNESRQAGASH